MTSGGAPADSRGQKYCSWRSAAEWKVRACTPPDAEVAQPGAHLARGPGGEGHREHLVRRRGARRRPAYAIRWVIARVLPVPAPARMQTGPRTASAACALLRVERSREVEQGRFGHPRILSSGTDGNICLWGPGRKWGKQVVVETVSRLTMYTTVWCGYCVRLKRALEREGIDFVEVDIEQDAAAPPTSS